MTLTKGGNYPEKQTISYDRRRIGAYSMNKTSYDFKIKNLHFLFLSVEEAAAGLLTFAYDSFFSRLVDSLFACQLVFDVSFFHKCIKESKYLHCKIIFKMNLLIKYLMLDDKIYVLYLERVE